MISRDGYFRIKAVNEKGCVLVDEDSSSCEKRQRDKETKRQRERKRRNQRVDATVVKRFENDPIDSEVRRGEFG